MPPAPPPIAGLVAADLATQRLFRVEVSGAEGSSTLRLALRLWRADRFEAVASDLLGRSLWVLEIDGSRGRLRSPRERTACRLAAAEPVSLPGLELPLPARELPAVLLGRLPAPPGVVARFVAGEAGPIEAVASGERWSLELEAGQPAAWTVERPGGARLAWRREGARSSLAVDDAARLEWRESARERLAGAPPGLSPDEPAAECRDAADA